jgi:tight adherence protein B
MVVAATGAPEWDAVVAAARSAVGDVPAALRELGGAAARLAAAWEVCEATGAGLAAPVRRLADGLRDVAQVRREVDAQLAAPRATAWLLTGLPLVGVLMGGALGSDPVPLLIGTAWGRALLGTGVLLEVAGLLWVQRIVRSAQLDGQARRSRTSGR